MYKKLKSLSAIIGVAIIGWGGVAHARPAKKHSIQSSLSTVCNTGSWMPGNKVLLVEADCPSGSVALGGGPVGIPGNDFDTTLLATSGPVVPDSTKQPIGWAYSSIRSDSTLDDPQFASIQVTVCVECAQ